MMHSMFNKLILILSIPVIAFGAFGVSSDGRLDTKTLSSAYQESEFEPVRVSVEKYLKQKGEAATLGSCAAVPGRSGCGKGSSWA